MSDMPEDVVLRVKNLKKYFPIEKGLLRRVQGHVKAVDDVSFDIERRGTMGLVGESGCGKTTTARCILRAVDPTDGSIEFRRSDNSIVDIGKLGKRELKGMREDMQLVFQDPFSSLNPRMTILDIVSEPLKNFGWKQQDRQDRVADLLKRVGLDPKYMRRYPHAFSGGQRQRIGIARALALNPLLVVADEPVSALDVSVQAQVLNLLDELQGEFGLTYLFVAHDLSVIRHICDNVAVMYVGKLVETGAVADVFHRPLHPYTSALLDSVPVPEPGHDWLEDTLSGEVADASQDIQGCSFAPRCKFAQEICWNKRPPLKPAKGSDDTSHKAACHFAGELNLRGAPEFEESRAET